LSVDDALIQILTDFARLPAEQGLLIESLGRVLADDIRAETAIPPFANSSMDGYAVRAADLGGDNTLLRVVMDIPAGSPPAARALQEGEAARIMTGAPIPSGADAVIPVERTNQGWRTGENTALPDTVVIKGSAKIGDSIRAAGEDVQAGEIVLRAGTLIRPAEMGVLAALGVALVPVVRRPRVVILSTGDELVDADAPLTAGKIRDANGYTLTGLVSSYGGIPIRLPIARDTVDDVRARFSEALDAQPDIIVSSAGVSVGTFDVVKVVLDEMGAVGFWRVNLRPGKPLAYGHVRGVPFFGLPGNPVSAMVTFDVFVRPALLTLSGRPDAFPTITAYTGEALQSDGRRSYLRVILKREGDRLIATTTGTQSSGALTSMVRADGLMIIPENITDISTGTPYPVRLIRPLE
jgi:molybdopterin molybdotransferase